MAGLLFLKDDVAKDEDNHVLHWANPWICPLSRLLDPVQAIQDIEFSGGLVQVTGKMVALSSVWLACLLQAHFENLPVKADSALFLTCSCLP